MMNQVSLPAEPCSHELKKKIIITYNRKFDYKEAHYYDNLLYLHFFLNGTLCPRFEQTIYSVKISVKFVG